MIPLMIPFQLWSYKELQNTGIRAIYLNKAPCCHTIRVGLKEPSDVDLIGITEENYRKAYSFKDYPKVFAMVDRHDGSKLIFYFKQFGRMSLVTYKCQYN